MCLSKKDIIQIISNQRDQKKPDNLLKHMKTCDKCRNKVEQYKKDIEEFEDSIKYSNRGLS